MSTADCSSTASHLLGVLVLHSLPAHQNFVSVHLMERKSEGRLKRKKVHAEGSFPLVKGPLVQAEYYTEWREPELRQKSFPWKNDWDCVPGKSYLCPCVVTVKERSK